MQAAFWLVYFGENEDTFSIYPCSCFARGSGVRSGAGGFSTCCAEEAGHCRYCCEETDDGCFDGAGSRADESGADEG